MKKLLFFLVPLFIWSCTDDNQITEKVYEFNSVRWIKEAGDGEEFETIIVPEKIIENTGATVIPVVSSSDDYVKDKSVFTSDNPLAFTLEWNDKPFMVDVPTFDSSLTGYFYTQGFQVPYEEGETIIPPKLKITETTYLNPNARIIYNETVTIQKLAYTYEIVLVETTTFEELIIKGKWSGTFFYSGTGGAVIEEITPN